VVWPGHGVLEPPLHQARCLQSLTIRPCTEFSWIPSHLSAEHQRSGCEIMLRSRETRNQKRLRCATIVSSYGHYVAYGFKTDADLARCRMQLDLARLRRSSAGVVHAGEATPDTNSLSLSLLCRDAISRRDSVSMLVNTHDRTDRSHCLPCWST